MTESFNYNWYTSGFESPYGDVMFTDKFIYPNEPLSWQKVFLKMEIFGSREKNRTPDEVIYLPMPLGLMRSESSLSYQFEEFNVAGEYAKDLAGMMQGEKFGEPFRKLAESIQNSASDTTISALKGLGRSLNTILEQNIQSTTLEGIQALRAGAGYEYRYNYTKYFAQIAAQRQFRADWRLYPKNAKDARTIEAIMYIINKATLPEISNISFFDEFVNQFYGTDDSTPISELLDGPHKDVIEKHQKYHKLYSSTLRVPKEFKLSIYEISNEEHEPQKIENILNFPIPFVVEDVMIQIGGEDSEADTFIKDPEINEYYNASYMLSMGFKETTQFTSNNVDKLQTIKE